MDDFETLNGIKVAKLRLAIKQPNNWEAAIPLLNKAWDKIVARMWKECNP